MLISVVIPCRAGDVPAETLLTLEKQTLRPDVIIVVPDQGQGANWARNRGVELTTSKFVLMSDSDIVWHPNAVANLFRALRDHPEATYAFGSYEMEGKTYCEQPFDAAALRRCNLASTMSLFRRVDMPSFDETLLRFQDWDIYLTLLSQGKLGVHCGQQIFCTEQRLGITFGKEQSCVESLEIISKKHGLA